ncbi:hypothetical protein [Hymenobacter edaphi]|uniref:hypothetical protein n=1 Tax=Hymenobacter edaphi TaxID=2211146 RepID=UPI001057D192|nr:hypothetical protein [Hymenobacter edaphi]
MNTWLIKQFSPRLFSRIILLSFVMSVSSCTSEEEQTKINQMAQSLHATISTKIGYIKTNEKGKESGKYLEVTITDPATITPENHDDLHYPAAKYASALYYPYTKDSRVSYDFIRIVFSIESERSTFEYSYPIIKRYNNQYERIEKIINSLHHKSFHVEYFNTNFIKADDAHKIHELIRSIHPDSVELVGFKSADVQSIQGLAIKYQVIRKGKKERLTIVTDFNSSNAPIIGVTLNSVSD